MSLFYFASDGNYGGADGMVVIDTKQWTERDWGFIEESSDEYRPHLAMIIAGEYGN